MLHRDQIIIQKISSEIDIGIDMMGKTELNGFLADEKLKRAISMTALKEQLSKILIG